MNKYTKQLQSKFDELYAKYVDDFCPEELHDVIRESLEQDLHDLANDGCIFDVDTRYPTLGFRDAICELEWPCIMCCMKSHIRSDLYKQCGLYDEMTSHVEK